METQEEYEAAWDEALAGAEAAVAAEHDEVTGIGGLYVLGTSGTSLAASTTSCVVGPAGDPGESRFYLSLAGRPDAAVQRGPGRPVHGSPGWRTTSRSSRRW